MSKILTSCILTFARLLSHIWVLLTSFKGVLSFETGSHCIDLAGLELTRSAWLCLPSTEIKDPYYQLSFDYLSIYMALLGIEPVPRACRVGTLPKELYMQLNVVYIFYSRPFRKRCIFELSSRQRNILFNYLVHVNGPLFWIYIYTWYILIDHFVFSN